MMNIKEKVFFPEYLVLEYLGSPISPIIPDLSHLALLPRNHSISCDVFYRC